VPLLRLAAAGGEKLAEDGSGIRAAFPERPAEGAPELASAPQAPSATERACGAAFQAPAGGGSARPAAAGAGARRRAGAEGKNKGRRRRGVFPRSAESSLRRTLSPCLPLLGGRSAPPPPPLLLLQRVPVSVGFAQSAPAGRRGWQAQVSALLRSPSGPWAAGPAPTAPARPSRG